MMDGLDHHKRKHAPQAPAAASGAKRVRQTTRSMLSYGELSDFHLQHREVVSHRIISMPHSAPSPDTGSSYECPTPEPTVASQARLKRRAAMAVNRHGTNNDASSFSSRSTRRRVSFPDLDSTQQAGQTDQVTLPVTADGCLPLEVTDHSQARRKRKAAVDLKKAKTGDALSQSSLLPPQICSTPTPSTVAPSCSPCSTRAHIVSSQSSTQPQNQDNALGSQIAPSSDDEATTGNSALLQTNRHRRCMPDCLSGHMFPHIWSIMRSYAKIVLIYLLILLEIRC